MESKIEIIEEHSGWMAVNKPAGISVHNSETGDNLLSILREQVGYSLHAVHRLDSPTSGIILLGKNAQQTKILQQSLANATKEYTAILRGVVEPKEGDWTWRISNKGEGFRNPQGRKSDRVPAITSFRTIRSNTYLSLVNLTLGTGRQHQIRKHAALANHPVIFDRRYGDRRYNSKLTQRYGVNQLCLCATKLDIVINSKAFSLVVSLPKNWSLFF